MAFRTELCHLKSSGDNKADKTYDDSGQKRCSREARAQSARAGQTLVSQHHTLLGRDCLKYLENSTLFLVRQLLYGANICTEYRQERAARRRCVFAVFSAA